MKIRDRIRELRRVPARDLIPNPRNWRTHPQAQQDALRGLLAEIGYAGALVVRETAEGLMIIDGHLRAETTPDMEVPVLVVDVTAEEGDKLLLSLDPLAGLAETNKDALAGLLATVGSESEAVRNLFARIAEDSGISPPDFDPATFDEQGRLDRKNEVECPSCGMRFTP
jgi:hypothetical protein